MIRARKMLLLLCLALLAATGCLRGGPSYDPLTTRALRRGDIESLGSFRVTFYWIPDERSFSGPRTTPLYGPGGEVLGRFPAGFASAAKLEGCGILADGRRITVRTREAWRGGKEPGFVFTSAPYGKAADGRPLKPLRSAAVDPKVIPLGTTLYIPKTNGVIIRGGRVATGNWVAHDTGSAIRGQRIDLFIGSRKAEYAFAARGITSKSRIEVFRVVGGR